MATDDEKREIARQFILQSPCHELKQVVKDVRVLVGDDAMMDELLPGVVREYNMEHYQPFESPYGNLVTLCEEGAHAEHEHAFLDPMARRYFTVTDHVKGLCEEADYPAQESVPPLRDSLQAKLDTYVREHYRAGAGTVFHVTSEGGEFYVICLNSEKSNPGSSWSGRWKSKLVITLSSPTSCSVEGHVHNLVHYYEEGNVQMDTGKSLKKDIAADSEDAMAHLIVKFLEAAEAEFHMKIDEMCQSMSDKALKSLRRRLPVSKQPFNFSSGAHKLAMELGKVGQ
eukprot:TRINITY_DN22650_c0_g1_i1.p1 TRINITY_DN22650_c0_g1~~TRINITY_DN22650_c0_g1_i1.p1  ORF type:complete len:284 (+),score=108.79 TRINITY_DN22650_c0_g1_i1:75-926(+)